MQSKEDFDGRLDRVGVRGLRSEVRDGLQSDGVLLLVQVDDNLISVLKLVDRGNGREERISNKEH